MVFNKNWCDEDECGGGGQVGIDAHLIKGIPVELTTLSDGQILKYDSNSGKWVNSEDTGGGGGGTGDVVGPASSEDNVIPLFDGITGKLLQESGVKVDAQNRITAPYGGLSNTEVFGLGANTTNHSSVAIGPNASSGLYSVCLGRNTQGTYNYSVSLGDDARTTGGEGISIGASARAPAYGLAVGLAANADTSFGMAVGRFSDANGQNAIVFGAHSNAGPYGISLGSSIVNSGNEAIAIGNASNAGTYNEVVVIGASASVDGINSIAIGRGAVGRLNSIVIGKGAVISVGNDSAVSLGYNANVNGVSGTALGAQTIAGQSAAALGRNAQATGQKSFAAGYNSRSTNNQSFALGADSTASGSTSTAIGGNSTSSATGAFAMGYGAVAGGTYSISLGRDANASFGYDVAIGRQSVTRETQSISIGSRSSQYRAIYVGAGQHDISVPLDIKIQASTPDTSNTDSIGTELRLIGGGSTGNANGAPVKIQTVVAGGASGTTINLTTRDNFKAMGDGFNTQSTPNSVIPDAHLDNGSIGFYLDEANDELKVKAKYSNGTVKTATLALVA